VSRSSEKALHERLLARDPEACAEIVRVCQAPIFRLLYQLCRDRHIAEDLTQETFAAAWANIDAYQGSSSIRTWLHRIAYRKFVDMYRRRAVTVAATLNKITEPAVLNTPSPAEAVLIEEQAYAVREAMEMLSAPERDLLILRYFQELGFKEVSEVLDEPIGTLKWRASQALTKLRSLLAESQEYGTEAESSRV